MGQRQEFIDTMKKDKWHYAKLVKTPDNFHPSFDGGFVKCFVTLMPVYKQKEKVKPYIRISFWGDDDFGMEKNIFFDNKGTAKTEFRKLKEKVSKLNVVTIEQLKKDGFFGV